MPKQKGLCVAVLQKKKNKQKEKKIKGISCLCGATVIVNSNPLIPPSWTEKSIQALRIHERIQQGFAKENLQRFNIILCFYFKGKFWEVNFT